jgi:hypothetical protein
MTPATPGMFTVNRIMMRQISGAFARYEKARLVRPRDPKSAMEPTDLQRRICHQSIGGFVDQLVSAGRIGSHRGVGWAFDRPSGVQARASGAARTPAA